MNRRTFFAACAGALLLPSVKPVTGKVAWGYCVPNVNGAMLLPVRRMALAAWRTMPDSLKKHICGSWAKCCAEAGASK